MSLVITFYQWKKKLDAKLLCESKISNEMTKLSFNVVHLVTIFRFLYYFYFIVIRYYKILSSSDDKCCNMVHRVGRLQDFKCQVPFFLYNTIYFIKAYVGYFQISTYFLLCQEENWVVFEKSTVFMSEMKNITIN